MSDFKVKYEIMTPSEFKEALNNKPVAYLPLGLLEWHGEHLPLGADGLKSHAIGCMVAERIGGIVFPPVYFGRPGYSSFLGTAVFSKELVKKLIVETCGQLEKLGFSLIVAIRGHGGPAQNEAVEEAIEEYNSSSKAKAISIQALKTGVEGTDIEGAHGGAGETALVVGTHPDLVHLDRFQPGEIEVEKYLLPEEELWPEERGKWNRWKQDPRRMPIGKIAKDMVERVVDKIISEVEKNEKSR